MVDAAVACHLEILGFTPLWRFGVVERVRHADALDRLLSHAINDQRLRKTRHFQQRGRNVDHVMELRANLALSFDSPGPMHNQSVACTAPMRCHLLGPLVGRVHRMRPAHRVVIVGLDPAEFFDMRLQELRRLKIGKAGKRHQLVVGALQGALARGAVVADDQIDQRVVDDVEILQRVDEEADVIVGMLHEAREDLHLTQAAPASSPRTPSPKPESRHGVSSVRNPWE